MFELLKIGGKIELQIKNDSADEGLPKISYSSQIMDFKQESILCSMPIYEGKLIPLEVGTSLDAFFYTDKSTYKADCTVIDRGKEGNIYTVELKPESQLEKFQRREFYRLECTKEVLMIELSDSEAEYLKSNKKLPEKLRGFEQKGIIVDISGGGLRIFARKSYERNTYLSFKFSIEVNGEEKVICIPGVVVMALISPNSSDIFDNRIQFVYPQSETTELIVKYIFEQQRLQRQKERR